ncbi:MAG: UvrD-helicase domain-containing protein [Patescibacteria group bacterium]|jgi:DNA helicase-2/ATP-dependent DNA helicase PcrA
MREFVLTPTPGSAPKIDYKGELNDEQYAVVENGDGPCLVLAGAGSGKTRTVTYRVAWLLEHGVPPDRILLLTFTNKAAREMLTRVEALLKTFPQGLWTGTFHSISNRLLRMYGDRTPFGRDFSILDEEDANDLMKLCIKERKIAVTGERFPSASVVRSVGSYAINARLSIAEVLQSRHPAIEIWQDDIVAVLSAYGTAKVQQKAMDFDDLLVKLLELLKSDDDLRQKLGNKFAYVLVDEFQDTNVIQAELVDLLSGVNRNLLVVGDDAQSIYSFRAAEIKNILDFPKHYEGAQVFRLVVNYRSTPEILAVANAVIKNNTEQFSKDLQAVVPSGDKPLMVPASDERQEAQYVMQQILQLMDEDVKLGKIAVLFRAAFHSQALEFELMRNNIPYEYRGGLKFFERAHVKDAIAHLRILRNVKDGMAWMRALQIQPGMGLATANKTANFAGVSEDAQSAIASYPALGAKAAQGWRNTVEILGAMLVAGSPAHTLRAFSASDSYKKYLEAEYPNARERIEDLEQFALFAEQYDKLGDFLDAVTLTGDFGVRLEDPEQTGRRTEQNEDKLILSTIHQAKGLEWDNVFIIHLAEGAFPHSRAYAEANGLAEERRLFYVAATRARQRLYFTYPVTTGFENIEIRQPSQFLDEIPRELIEEVRLRTSMPAWSAYSSASRVPAYRKQHNPYDDEPTIVLDASGEPTNPKQMPASFLRNIEDL